MKSYKIFRRKLKTSIIDNGCNTFRNFISLFDISIKYIRLFLSDIIFTYSSPRLILSNLSLYVILRCFKQKWRRRKAINLLKSNSRCPSIRTFTQRRLLGLKISDKFFQQWVIIRHKHSLSL